MSKSDKKLINFPGVDIDQTINPQPVAPVNELQDMVKGLAQLPGIFNEGIFLTLTGHGELNLMLTTSYRSSPLGLQLALGQLDLARSIILSNLQLMLTPQQPNSEPGANPPTQGS